MQQPFLRALFSLGLILALGASPAFGQPDEDFDIYVFDVKKGTTQQVTSIPGAGEFNPSFSNNGKLVVHDVLVFVPSFSHDLYVTDVATGTSTPLAGADGGNDAAWSPNGRHIAFDRVPAGDFRVYTVPAAGGTRTLVRADAIDPDWSNDSKRLVFTDVTDGSVRTVDINTGAETAVAPAGLNPVWSGNGKAIAFSDGNNLFVVPVDGAGHATGPPAQVTFDGVLVFNAQPSWSNNGKTLVFHSNRGNAVFDFDLWTVPAAGGTPTLLAGLAGAGDFDPSFSKNGKHVAYAGFTPPAPKRETADAGFAARGGLARAADVLGASSYPNPFNPATMIAFTLPEAGPVTLKVYDLMGREVATLVQGTLDAGTHEARFDAGPLPSGTYLYRLQAGGRHVTNRIVLVK